MSRATKRVNGIKLTAENKCSFCHGATCCTYITQQIDTPRSKAAFELMLWQVSHRNVQYYKDEDGWFLLIDTPCDHLQVGGRCGIYAQRPAICREHSNDYCEYDSPAEESFDLHFNDYNSLLDYCKRRFKSWGR